MLICPSELRYTQNSIKHSFSNGVNLENSLWRLLRNVNEVQSRIENVPKMRVVEYETGVYYVVSGNRRLYLFQKMESAGIIKDVEVIAVPIDTTRFARQHTTACEGKYVKVRGCRNMDARLSHVVQKYEQKKRGKFL